MIAQMRREFTPHFLRGSRHREFAKVFFIRATAPGTTFTALTQWNESNKLYSYMNNLFGLLTILYIIQLLCAATFQLIIKKRARVPAGDSFVARRIAGPGLASNYFYQVCGTLK